MMVGVGRERSKERVKVKGLKGGGGSAEGTRVRRGLATGAGQKPQRLRSGIPALCGHGMEGIFSRSMSPDRPSGRGIPCGRARAPGEGEGQAVRLIRGRNRNGCVLGCGP